MASDKSIERWWELVFSAYLLVSIQASNFQSQHFNQEESQVDDLSAQSLLREPISTTSLVGLW